ncbi:hypothetical protein AX16_004482 [Volvariella volvacea WC 439]|nr:hypothetical protein AX16_004482 [Volvariella volvacea WC 439]
MPEYVYALHDFLPEHEDELPFRAGERIEVLERDDMYGDGWWKGQNLAGKIGLFPQTYTAPALPSGESAPIPSTSSQTIVGDSSPELDAQPIKSGLRPLEEESEAGSPQVASPVESPHIVSSVPTTAALVVNGNESEDESHIRRRTTSGGDGEVMKATMTDVQKAIEQLGKGRGMTEDGDGARSFSFASTRDGETDTDIDLSDMDTMDNSGGEAWHADARKKLAEKARKAVEEAEKLEAMMNGNRVVAPPIDVELSDESDDEDGVRSHRDDNTGRSALFYREHPIPEEEEESDVDLRRISVGRKEPNEPKTDLAGKLTSSPEPQFQELGSSTRNPETPEPQTATATQSTFPKIPSPSPSPSPSPTPMTPTIMAAMPVPNGAAKEPARLSFPAPISPNLSQSHITTPPRSEPSRSATPQRNSYNAMPSPSPTGSINGRSQSLPRQNSTPFVRPSSPLAQMPSPPPVMPAPRVQSPPPAPLEKKAKEKAPPVEWSVDDVVDWLKSKGFDKDVCDKFTEQEITGDVLLELDVNILKSEIGIVAFGKRTRIVNAITDLKRPPSITSSDKAEQLSQAQPSPLSPVIQNLPVQTHSRAQSQTYSHHSFPGATNGYHSHTQSIQSSLASPLGSAPPPGGSPLHSAGANGHFVGGFVPMSGSESSAHSSGIGAPERQEGLGGANGLIVPPPPINGRPVKGRPAHLSLSPSDTALSDTVKAVVNIPEEREDDRGHMSEGEIVQNGNSRRRLFGLSQDLNLLRDREKDRESQADSVRSDPLKPIGDSKELSSPTHSTAGDSVSSRRAKSKRSIDGGKVSDRLSIFGGSFGPTLGKSRKPAPRYSSDETLPEKSSVFAIPKLHSSSSRRSASVGGSQKSSITATNAPLKEPKENLKDSKEKDPALLRKRTSTSIAGSGTAKFVGGATLKPGISVIDQIGEPDHNGWMRKKGDRYNSWKLRYFILKGSHLYCLRSNDKSETKIKGYIKVTGYKVTVDENIDPGRYGFRIDHDNDKTHYFSSDEKSIVREWMKAIMKATIGRDYSRPVISSCNIPTIPLAVAQTMNPAPRPPSPTARDATQKALRRENPNQLSSRDARILMGLPSSNGDGGERARLDSFFTTDGARPITIPSPNLGYEDLGEPQTPTVRTSAVSASAAPPRPSREMRRVSSVRTATAAIDDELIDWANSHLPLSLRVRDSAGPLYSGLALLRLAESIKGKPSSPPVPDSAFPTDPTDDKLDGLFKLFDFLLDNDVKMGSVSINDVRQGKRDKIVQLLKALKAWEDKRRALTQSIGRSSVQAAGFMAPVGWA